MNKHIELVKKWLADPNSVTQKELDENVEGARVASWDADAVRAGNWAAHASYRDAYRASWAARCAAYWAAEAATENAAFWAKHWVERYEERVNEKIEVSDIIQHQQVLNALTPQGLLDYGEEMLMASILCEDDCQAQKYSEAYDVARDRYNSLSNLPEVW